MVSVAVKISIKQLTLTEYVAHLAISQGPLFNEAITEWTQGTRVQSTQTIRELELCMEERESLLTKDCN